MLCFERNTQTHHGVDDVGLEVAVGLHLLRRLVDERRGDSHARDQHRDVHPELEEHRQNDARRQDVAVGAAAVQRRLRLGVGDEEKARGDEEARHGGLWLAGSWWWW